MKNKILTVLLAILIIAALFTMGLGEVHIDKATQFVDNKTTYTSERQLSDSNLYLKSIRKKIKQKIDLSKTQLYDLSKQRIRLESYISSTYGQIDRLRKIGNNKREQLQNSDAVLKKLKIQKDNISDSNEKVTKSNRLKQIDSNLSSNKFEVQALENDVIEVFNKIKYLESSLDNSKNMLSRNIKKVKIASATSSKLSNFLNQIEAAEIEAGIFSTSSGLTTRSASEVNELMASVEALQNIYANQNEEFIGAYVAEDLMFNSEILETIKREGF